MIPSARNARRAFSLVELVIVVVIIGIIGAIAIPRLSRGAEGAKDSSLRGNLSVLRSAIEFYEVVAEKDEDEERLRVYSVHMEPGDTSVRVPAEFLEAGKDYKVEIIAQESSGNRTAIEVPFATVDDKDE